MRIDPITGFQPYVAPVTEINENEIAQPIKKIVDNSYYKDTIDHAKEHYLEKEFINVMTAQRKNHEDSSIISSELLKDSISANNDIRKELYDQQDELIQKQKKSDVLSIVDKVSMGCLVVLGLVGIGLTIVSGFGGVPVLLTVANAFLALVNGGTKIANGVIKYQSDQISAQIFELGEKRKMHQTKSTDHMEKQNSSKEEILNSFKMISENERRKQETVSAIMGRS